MILMGKEAETERQTERETERERGRERERQRQRQRQRGDVVFNLFSLCSSELQHLLNI